MSRQRVWILATSVVAAGLGASALLIWGGYSTTPTLLGTTLAVTLAVGWSFSVLGVIAAVYWPSSQTGLLMIGVGLAWFARAIGAVDSPFMFSAGALIGSLYLAILVHLMVTYPTGRLVSRGQRLVVAAAYLCTIPLNFVGRWLLTNSGTCRDCRFNLLTTSGQPGAPDAGHQILFVLLVCVTLAVLVFMAARWHAASPASRRSLAPPLWGALTILGAVAAHRIGTYFISPARRRPCSPGCRRRSWFSGQSALWRGWPGPGLIGLPSPIWWSNSIAACRPGVCRRPCRMFCTILPYSLLCGCPIGRSSSTATVASLRRQAKQPGGPSRHSEGKAT